MELEREREKRAEKAEVGESVIDKETGRPQQQTDTRQPDKHSVKQYGQLHTQLDPLLVTLEETE
jgi:hypothetical protein